MSWCLRYTVVKSIPSLVALRARGIRAKFGYLPGFSTKSDELGFRTTTSANVDRLELKRTRYAENTIGSWIRKNSVSVEFLRIQLRVEKSGWKD